MSKKQTPNQKDSAYFLKLVLYLIVASQWLRIVPHMQYQIPVPYGAIIALVFASHEHFRIDRKIEYAVILVAMLLGFWMQPGILFLV